MNRATGSAWAWPLDLDGYDRAWALTAAERAALAARHGRRKRIAPLFDHGALPALPAGHALARLLQPVLDAWRVAGRDRQEVTDGAALLVAEMHRRRTAYWAWDATAWLALLGPSYRTFQARHHKARTCRLFLIVFSYLIGGLTHAPVLSQCRLRPLAQRVFGPDRVAQALAPVCAALGAWGYTPERLANRTPGAVCLLLLVRRSPLLADLSTELLAQVRAAGVPERLGAQLAPLSRALVHLGCLDRTLEQVQNATKRARYQDDHRGVPAPWLAWCRRWRDTSTHRPAARQALFCNLIKTGRWLAAVRPQAADPASWTRAVAAEFVAAVDRMRVGEWCAPGTHALHVTRRGCPLKAAAKEKLIYSVRRFFADAHDWGWWTARLDPARSLGTPRSVRALIGPDPRVIADDIWAKLLWAGLNLTEADTPHGNFRAGRGARQAFYPLAMLRALSTVWLFTGLRTGEIRRLRVGCVRAQRAATRIPWTTEPLPADAVCWLDVPVGKTATAFTKAVDRVVGEAVAAWEHERPPQPRWVDEHTGEVVDLLFCFRAHPLGATYLNATLIPLLCRKAGVPRHDVRGPITAHRARSTIASQLFNAKEPLTLFELQEWLGHRLVTSTQHYAKLTPTKVAKAYEQAGYFARNVRVMEVLLDQQAVQSGAAAAGEPWKYYDLGHGYCTYDFFDQCAHRMACAKCSFYRPKEALAGLLQEGHGHLQRMLQDIPLLDDERAAVEDGRDALDALLRRLATVPTPDQPGTPSARSSSPDRPNA